MKTDNLTGIERDLVLQYLMDGNIPVTITPIDDEKKEKDNIQSLSSQVFPIALKGEHLKIEKNGKIQLLNPTKSVMGFIDKKVKVEFYFNRLGLYFYSKIILEKDELCIFVPDEINRIKDITDETNYDFSALLYIDFKQKKNISLKLIPWEKEDLFTRPVWKSIPLENQKIAKNYLEDFVNQAKTERNAGNGIQLIPICNYLTYEYENKMEALKDRKKPLSILYIDHERLVFGMDYESEDIQEKDEFGIKLSFSIKNSPILSRDIFATCRINKKYTDKNNTRECIDCVFTSMQEEDLRYLYEKATKLLFI